MRISDLSSDVCSSDLSYVPALSTPAAGAAPHARPSPPAPVRHIPSTGGRTPRPQDQIWPYWPEPHPAVPLWRESCRRISASVPAQPLGRSEEHTSELQSLMRISYAVFCLKKKKNYHKRYKNHKHQLYTIMTQYNKN